MIPNIESLTLCVPGQATICMMLEGVSDKADGGVKRKFYDLRWLSFATVTTGRTFLSADHVESRHLRESQNCAVEL